MRSQPFISVFFFLFFMSFICRVNAQDIIILKDNSQIEAKIEEVKENEIKYKKYNSPEGPTFFIPTRKLAAVKFENGDIQTYPIQHYNWPPHSTGFNIGYVSKSVYGKRNGIKYSKPFMDIIDTNSNPALRGGVIYSTNFKYGLGLITGVYFEYCKEEINSRTTDGYVFERIAYDWSISIPVQLKYRYCLSKKLFLFAYTGLSLDVGIIYHYESHYGGPLPPSIWKPGISERPNLYSTDFHRINLLWASGVGIEFFNFRLSIGTDWGLTNLERDRHYFNTKIAKPISVGITYFIPL